MLYVRNPAVVGIARRDAYHVIQPRHPVFTLRPTDVDAISRLMAIACQPISAATIDDICGRATRADLENAGVLLRSDAAEASPSSAAGATADRPCQHLVLGLTGAIATAQVAPYTLDLFRKFAQRIDVILTSGARRIVRPQFFNFVGITAWTDPFEAHGRCAVPHIHLAETATLIAVVPASAGTLHRLATGACSDLLSLTITATRAPVVLFPAMNAAMWDSPPVRRNISQLRQDGFFVVEPTIGIEVANATPGYGSMGVGPLGPLSVLREVLALVNTGP